MNITNQPDSQGIPTSLPPVTQEVTVKQTEIQTPATTSVSEQNAKVTETFKKTEETIKETQNTAKTSTAVLEGMDTQSPPEKKEGATVDQPTTPQETPKDTKTEKKDEATTQEASKEAETEKAKAQQEITTLKEQVSGFKKDKESIQKEIADLKKELNLQPVVTEKKAESPPPTPEKETSKADTTKTEAKDLTKTETKDEKVDSKDTPKTEAKDSSKTETKDEKIDSKDTAKTEAKDPKAELNNEISKLKDELSLLKTEKKALKKLKVKLDKEKALSQMDESSLYSTKKAHQENVHKFFIELKTYTVHIYTVDKRPLHECFANDIHKLSTQNDLDEEQMSTFAKTHITKLSQEGKLMKMTETGELVPISDKETETMVEQLTEHAENYISAVCDLRRVEVKIITIEAKRAANEAAATSKTASEKPTVGIGSKTGATGIHSSLYVCHSQRKESAEKINEKAAQLLQAQNPPADLVLEMRVLLDAFLTTERINKKAEQALEEFVILFQDLKISNKMEEEEINEEKVEDSILTKGEDNKAVDTMRTNLNALHDKLESFKKSATYEQTSTQNSAIDGLIKVIIEVNAVKRVK